MKKNWSDTDLLDFEKRWKAITIPVNLEIENKQIALDLTRTYHIIERADKIALGDCICRVTVGNCDNPRDTCIFLNDRAKRLVENGRATYITKERAKKVVKNSHEKGLVHLALFQTNQTDPIPSEICSCCSCCCQALQGLKRMSLYGLVEPSDLVAHFNSNACSQCGICVDRCQFGARTFNSEMKIVFSRDLCFGCGLCVSSCPENIITLIPR